MGSEMCIRDRSVSAAEPLSMFLEPFSVLLIQIGESSPPIVYSPEGVWYNTATVKQWKDKSAVLQ